jgi:hypothetical protein
MADVPIRRVRYRHRDTKLGGWGIQCEDEGRVWSTKAASQAAVRITATSRSWEEARSVYGISARMILLRP